MTGDYTPSPASATEHLSAILTARNTADVLLPPAERTGETVALVGNLTASPELVEKTGVPYCRLRVAVNRPGSDGTWKTKTTEFHTVVAFGSLAINVAASLRSGDRVVIAGEVTFSEWEGERRYSVVAEGIGPCLRFNTADVQRTNNHAAPTKGNVK